jgi:hypothetical protein
LKFNFPSVAARAPRLVLTRFESLASSDWTIDWSPPWSVEITIEGKKLIVCHVLVNVSEPTISGELNVNIASDLSSAKVWHTFALLRPLPATPGRRGGAAAPLLPRLRRLL